MKVFAWVVLVISILFPIILFTLFSNLKSVIGSASVVDAFIFYWAIRTLVKEYRKTKAPDTTTGDTK